MESAGGVFTSYPTMSSGYGDFARDNQQQQQSSNYSQRRTLHEIQLTFFSVWIRPHEKIDLFPSINR